MTSAWVVSSVAAAGSFQTAVKWSHSGLQAGSPAFSRKMPGWKPIAPGPVSPLPKTVMVEAAPTAASPAVAGEPGMVIIGAIGRAEVSVMM